MKIGEKVVEWWEVKESKKNELLIKDVDEDGLLRMMKESMEKI